jgi:hypothetical protein
VKFMYMLANYVSDENRANIVSWPSIVKEIQSFKINSQCCTVLPILYSFVPHIYSESPICFTFSCNKSWNIKEVCSGNIGHAVRIAYDAVYLQADQNLCGRTSYLTSTSLGLSLETVFLLLLRWKFSTFFPATLFIVLYFWPSVKWKIWRFCERIAKFNWSYFLDSLI